MPIFNARVAFSVRSLGSFAFVVLATALLLVSTPVRSNANPLSSDAPRTVLQASPYDRALPTVSRPAPAQMDAATARIVHSSRSAATLSPVLRRSALTSRSIAYQRTAASSRTLATGRFFDRSAAAAKAAKLRTPAVAPAAEGNSDIVRTALTYRGTPYRYGGRGRGGIDCSGFTGAVFAQMGTRLPRTAAAQFGRGMPVGRGDLQQGDLVFFGNTYRRGISHVGIYVGNGKFVHASSSRGVRVDSLGSSYFARRWAGARRTGQPKRTAAAASGQG